MSTLADQIRAAREDTLAAILPEHLAFVRMRGTALSHVWAHDAPLCDPVPFWKARELLARRVEDEARWLASVTVDPDGTVHGGNDTYAVPHTDTVGAHWWRVYRRGRRVATLQATEEFIRSAVSQPNRFDERLTPT